MSTPLEHAPLCVQVIINGLCDRRGFDDWWNNLDDDMQQDVIDEICDAIGI